MRAISSFSREAGISSFWWRACIELRMRVRKSATGSVKLILFLLLSSPVCPAVRGNPAVTYCVAARFWLLASGEPVRILHPTRGQKLIASSFLPRRLHDPGYLALERQTAETEAA